MPRITSSTAKLREWARIRALDVRAGELMASGMEREAAYVRAMDETEGIEDTYPNPPDPRQVNRSAPFGS